MVPQIPWIEIAMDFLFLKQLVVYCMKLIPGMRFSDKQKPHFVTCCKVLNIIDRLCGYTYIIPCTGAINAAGVIVIFETHIKPTIGLPCSIVSEPDVLLMSTQFQDWLIKNGMRHKVSTTYYAETDSQAERRNRELREMFAAHELQGTAWLTAAPKVQIQVNSRVTKAWGQSPFFSLHGFLPEVGSTAQPHPISVYSHIAQSHHSAAKDWTLLNTSKSRMPTSTGDQLSTIRNKLSLCPLPRTFQQTSSSCASFPQNGQAPSKCWNTTSAIRMSPLTSQIQVSLNSATVAPSPTPVSSNSSQPMTIVISQKGNWIDLVQLKITDAKWTKYLSSEAH